MVVLTLLLNSSCEDPLDSVVTKKDSNDLFELTLESSNQIVTSKGSLDITASVRRLQAGIADVSNKVLGVWNLIYDQPDTIDQGSLEIEYTFKSDGTVSREETYRFAEVFSKIVGKWNISSIGADTINSELFEIEYEFEDDTTVTIEETHKFDVSRLGSQVLGQWEVTESIVSGSAVDLSGKTLKYTFENDSSVTYERTEETSGGIDIGYASVPTFVDIDKDADKDLFVGSLDGTIHYFENTGTSMNAVFNEKTGSSNPLNGVVVNGAAAPAFVDIDGDGDMDLFIGQEDGTISYYVNGGSSTTASFSEATGANNPLNGVDIGYNAIPTFTDIDADGDMDAFLGEYDGQINYYGNTGNSTTATFVAGAATDTLLKHNFGTNAAPAFVDVDKDGDMDVFVGAGDGTLQYFTNTGTSTSHSFSHQTGDSNPLSAVDAGDNALPAFEDIDGDGDSDVFIGEYDGNVNHYRNSGSIVAAVFTLQTDKLGSSVTATRTGGWSFASATSVLKVAYYDTTGGSEESGSVSFDSDSLQTPLSSFMYWTTNKRTVTFKKTAHVTAFSAPADSVISKSGGWEYNKDDNTLSVTVYGETESGDIAFDTKASKVPIGAYMYWVSSSRGAITFVKTSNVSGADVTPDSVITSAGGWNWNSGEGTLTATIGGQQLSGNVTFETPGSVVPINGFMYWTTNEEGSLILKKKSNVSGSTSSMKLAMDATGGSLDIHHVSSASNITIVMADTAKAKFQVEGLFVPSSNKKNALISAKFQDLFLKIPVTIVER
ncbi:MAG: hypothetical protein CMG71_04220 [Candidatus Marinimicrobia bacterium]|nr:hypothetical protein [Candidatus Neomarinimicrobiota bacterium]